MGKKWENNVQITNNNTIGASLVQTGASNEVALQNELKVPILKSRETKTMEFLMTANNNFKRGDAIDLEFEYVKFSSQTPDEKTSTNFEFLYQ